MFARRRALVSAPLVLGATLVAGLGASPAIAAPAQAQGPPGNVNPEIVLEAKLPTNAEITIPPFQCSGDYPYLRDGRFPTRDVVPKGVTVVAGSNIVVALTRTPTTVELADGEHRVTGWGAEGGRAIAFHADPTGTAKPQALTIVANCADTPDLGYDIEH